MSPSYNSFTKVYWSGFIFKYFLTWSCIVQYRIFSSPPCLRIALILKCLIKSVTYACIHISFGALPDLSLALLEANSTFLRFSILLYRANHCKSTHKMHTLFVRHCLTRVLFVLNISHTAPWHCSRLLASDMTLQLSVLCDFKSTDTNCSKEIIRNWKLLDFQNSSNMVFLEMVVGTSQTYRIFIYKTNLYLQLLFFVLCLVLLQRFLINQIEDKFLSFN